MPTINTLRLLQREISIVPSLCYGRRHFAEALQLLSNGSIALPTEAFAAYSLDQPEHAFTSASRKEYLKVTFSIAES
jgi:threonine dehydrogenase-like Zn-dependent dehydrogenase